MQFSKGKIHKAQKVLIYGPEGIGKTTFASKFPDPVFIDTEGSTLHYDVTRFPYPCTSWQMVLSDVKDIIKEPTACKTLVIDTADWAEHLCEAAVLSNHQIGSIEDAGYGKGYTYIREEFGVLLNLLTEVTNKGVNVVLTAHAQMRKFEQPDALGSYDRWELKLSKQVAPLVKEWADVVLFANFKTYTVETSKSSNGKPNDKKLKATGSRRVMYLTHHQCWDAKNRWGIADDIDNPAGFKYELIDQFIEEPVGHIEESSSTNISEPVPETAAATAPTTPTQAASGSEPAPQPAESVKPPEPKPVEPPKAPQSQPPEPGSPIPEDFKPLDPAGTDDIKARNAQTSALDIPQALKDLMLKDNITEFDIQGVVGSKGYFPEDMRISDYPEDFVNGWIIKWWTEIVRMSQEIKKNQYIPFN